MDSAGAAAPPPAGTSWLDMSAAEFDARRATVAQRRVIETAPDTLFPRLLPEPALSARRAPAELAGQGDLFGGAL